MGWKATVAAVLGRRALSSCSPSQIAGVIHAYNRVPLMLGKPIIQCEGGVSSEIYRKDFNASGVGFSLRQSYQNSCYSHSYLYASTIKSPLQQEKVHGQNSSLSVMPHLLQAASLLRAKVIMNGVKKLSQRLIQTYPAAMCNQPWDHPWSRDKLAKRLSLLRERRIGKEISKERFRRILSQYSTSLPEMPLPSQPLTGVLQPRTAEDEKVAPLLARTDLIVTRNIEWANLLVGFEQENRYVIMDPRESLTVVGFITESSNWLARQFLRSRRPFHAAIMDAAGGVLFTVRRPIWFINSIIYAEVDGKVVGFAKRRWHLWRRIYDVYYGKRQFAVVENPGFWNWTFTLKDEDGRVLAEIDRHFRGFGYEMLTDAGQYAIRFGDVAPQYHPSPQRHSLTPEPAHIQGITVNPELETNQFTSERPLNLMERTVTLALAISLDNDYFSRHRGFFPFPFIADEQ